MWRGAKMRAVDGGRAIIVRDRAGRGLAMLALDGRIPAGLASETAEP